MFNKEKGITLIALIITIVVLIILAGIAITGSIQGIDKAHDNKLISDLDKVHHAITERYTKYKLTKDTSLLVGTKVTVSSLTDVPSSVTWKITGFDSVNNPEREYYRLNKSDLSNLGLSSDLQSNADYIVNYCTGEAYNETNKTTSGNQVLYVSSTNEQVSKIGDEIIKDGLLVWYDGENNTGSGHSSTTTVWKDLSGNNRDGIMTNVTLGSNYAEFNGTSSWVNMGEINSDYMTMEIVFYTNRTKGEDGFQTILANYGDYSGGGIGTQYNGFTGEYVVNNSYKTIIKNIAYINKNIKATLTYDGNIEKLFINGDYKDSINITGTITTAQNNMLIGRAPTGGHFLKGKIYSARVYNRALSDAEVKNNYLIDKAKYGIEE